MSLRDLMTFFLVLVRVGCIFVFLPFLGEGKAPRALKGLVILLLAVFIYPISGAEAPYESWRAAEFVRLVAAEVLLGCLMGFAARTIFSSLRITGELVGRQMGMALAVTADPVTGVQSTPIGNFCEVMGVLVLFSIGGHRLMLAALNNSFGQWPLGQLLSADFVRQVSVEAIGHAFVMALQIAAPLLLLTFLISLVMAVMARLVPEVNILIVGFPLRIGAGLIGLTLFVPLLVRCAAEVSRAMVHFLWGVSGGA